jgi:hypothetical protein
VVTTITPIAQAIEHKAHELRFLAGPSDGLELDRLRDETAALQAPIAEAARLQLQERPFDVKGTALFFPVLIETDDFVGYCRVSNLAPEGMKAEVCGTFSREQPVRVHLTAEERIHGALVWSGPGQVGVRFDHRIDVARVLASVAMPNALGKRSRHARLPFRCLAEISVGDRFQFVEIGDVSQRGAKVLTKVGMPGKTIAIQLHELEEREATVRWSRSGSTGLVFSKPLSFPELAQFVPQAAAGF